MPNPFSLTLSGINKAYDEGNSQHKVLDGLNLEITQGNKIAVLGRSGSGKTTLLHILNGLVEPDSGEYFFDGREIPKLSLHEKTKLRRYQISTIFQYYNLVPSLTAWENIEFGLKLAGKYAYRDKALEFCKQLEVNACLNKLPNQLSGGQQQRIAIIRALSIRPKLLLADEPTGNLDQHTGNLVAECLYQGVEAYGATLVLVTHSKDLASDSDIQYYLKDGHLERVV